MSEVKTVIHRIASREGRATGASSQKYDRGGYEGSSVHPHRGHRGRLTTLQATLGAKRDSRDPLPITAGNDALDSSPKKPRTIWVSGTY